MDAGLARRNLSSDYRSGRTYDAPTHGRSINQNRMYHALIREIASQAAHLGAKWDAEAWKRLLTHKWAKDTGRPTGQIVQSLDGDDIVSLGIQTRKFTKEDATEFTEFLLHWCAENGVRIEEKN